MHAHVTQNRFYPTQPQFAAAILAYFRETIPRKWHEFHDFVTDISVLSRTRFFGFWGKLGIIDISFSGALGLVEIQDSHLG